MAIRVGTRLRVAALILAGVGLTLTAAPVRASTQLGYVQVENPSEALSRHMRVLATEQRNFQALIGAGKAALALGDTQAAAGFFGRAEEAWPSSPLPQIGIGAALAHEGDGNAALRYFAKAAQLGATVQTFALDRGLAFDLLGRHSDAQSDYRIALNTVDADEARRRLALSLGIAGQKDEAIKLLGPLMARGDAAGARVRAFVLALTGDIAGARTAIDAAMPGSAAQMAYFFYKLPALRSDQKAAAVHLGLFPDSSQSGISVANVNQPGDRLKSIEDLLAATRTPPPPVQSVPAQTVAAVPQPSAGPVGASTQMASVASRRTTGTAISTKRHWVQLASGANAQALPDQFKRMKRRHPDLLEDLNPFVAEDSNRSRLLIGPFKDARDAAEFAAGLDSGGLDAFSWTAPQGLLIRKLSTE